MACWEPTLSPQRILDSSFHKGSGTGVAHLFGRIRRGEILVVEMVLESDKISDGRPRGEWNPSGSNLAKVITELLSLARV